MSDRKFITRVSYVVGVHVDHVVSVFDADGDEITGGDFTTPIEGCVALVETRLTRAGEPIIVREARRVLAGGGYEYVLDDDGNVAREVVPDEDEIARRAALAATDDGDEPDGDGDGDGDEGDEGGDVDLEDLKVAELQELAATRGIEVPAKATKAELVAALAATDDGDEPDGDEGDEGGD